VFLGKLTAIDASIWRSLAASPLTVVTARELPGVMQCQIRTALEARFGATVPLCFETSTALAWGIELRGAGQRIGWTSDTYLDSLEERLRGALDHLIEANPVAAAR
jgi:F0F1-type ATP synthase delta subunit